MKYLFTSILFVSSVFAAEICRFDGKDTWEGKTGLVTCTNFRGILVKDFQIKDGKQDGLERKYLEGKTVIGIAWYESPRREPRMEIGFDDYGEVQLITCGPKAYTDIDAKFCGFKGIQELKFTNFKGQLGKKARYLNGEIIELVTYFSSGKLKDEMKILGDQKKTTIYHEDGTLAAEAVEMYKKPVWEKEYYTENRLKSESQFKSEGEDLYLVRKKFYKNGKLQEEGALSASTTWSKEFYMGELKRYHENGQLSSKESYDKKGDLDGESIFYDNAGRVLIKRKFSHNTLMQEDNFKE